MEEVNPPSACHRHFLQKGKRTWQVIVKYFKDSVLVETFCPSENSVRDEDFQDWADGILDDLAEEKHETLAVITHLGPSKTKHHVYKLSDSTESE